MAETSTNETRTVRELAREVLIAQDAYNKAYWATCDGNQSIESRIDAQIAADAALKICLAARAALTAAQRSQVAA